MRNRAKCKLCQDIIESFHSTDQIFCKCGEIGLDGGTKMLTYAQDYSNFLRVDEDGNEIAVIVQDNPSYITDKREEIKRPSKQELLDELDMMVKNYSELPPQALPLPVTHYDLSSALLLISAILRSP